jgi:NAD(P)-dependent dehydrogenase (short-subunit alcohol dehydrogenase family)
MPADARYPSLAGKVVLITGAATGIGATLVERFAAQGSRVAFLDVDADAGQALAARLADAAPLFLAVDVTDIAALEAAIDEVQQRLGPVQVLINNAANDKRHSIAETTPASWDAGIAVNLKHQFFAARKVSSSMQAAGGGSIINLGSTSWMLKQGGMPVYTTSKSAVQGLTRSLARDLGRHGIRVNTLVPGWVMTEKQVRLWVDEAAKKAIAEGQCINAPLMPDHIAAMALFLAADDSAMCTGQDYIVDGGWA